MKLQMPDDIECVGGSTGRVCVVRCRNAAFAGRKLISTFSEYKD